MMARLGLVKGYMPIPKSREHLLKYQPVQQDLPTRSMKDSLTTAIIPLSSNKALQDRYVTVLGHLRIGRLLEDMDAFAVWICHQHLMIPNLPEGVPLPYTFVTILVDKITMEKKVHTSGPTDVRLSGHVTWVGRSSIEVNVWAEQEGSKDNWETITTAVFLMAARNATNNGHAPINALEPINEQEREILASAEERKKRRQANLSSSIFKVEPNDFEQTLMYSLYKRTTPKDSLNLGSRVLPANCRWMSEWYEVNTMPSFPENRNVHNTIFGGFLMRCALEISWVAANIYCSSRPVLAYISDISFKKPVSVNSFLRMTAYITYTELNYVQIMTVAEIIDSLTKETVTSNVFYFTYSSQDAVPEVVPRSYQETMWYIQGRRTFKNVVGME